MAFTHKLFLSRALYLDTVPRDHQSTKYALVTALDIFRERFHARYDLGVASRSIFGAHPSPRVLEKVERQVASDQHTRDAYFRYSQVDNEGDGSDKLKTIIVHDENFDPNKEKYYWWDEVIVEPVEEDVIGFYFDLGIQNPHHGHKDACQEIEDALKQAEEEDGRDAQLEKEATGLEDELMMVDVNTEEDDIGDIGMEALEL